MLFRLSLRLYELNPIIFQALILVFHVIKIFLLLFYIRFIMDQLPSLA